MSIPGTINGVTVEFAGTVNAEVEASLVSGLRHCIETGIAPGYTLRTIWVSSANDSHEAPSRHAQGKGVDISRINGTRIAAGYSTSAEVKAIVDAIQDKFESYAGARENFGPHLKRKSGMPHAVSGHGDHIHLSVD